MNSQKVSFQDQNAAIRRSPSNKLPFKVFADKELIIQTKLQKQPEEEIKQRITKPKFTFDKLTIDVDEANKHLQSQGLASVPLASIKRHQSPKSALTSKQTDRTSIEQVKQIYQEQID